MDSSDGEAVPEWAKALLDHMTRTSNEQSARIALLEKTLAENTPSSHLPTSTATTEGVTTPVTTDEIRRPRARLPDPATFDGERSEWPSWRVTVENKLAVDHKALGDTQAQFLYIYSRLSGNAWKNVTTYIKMRREDGNPQDFLNYLDTLYGDPNAKARAANRLHSLRQGEKQSFAKFLPVLEKEFADAGALHWPDEAKRPILLAALNSTMSAALVNRGVPQAFSDIINRLHEISTDMDMMSLRKPYRDRGSISPPRRLRLTPEPVYDPMDIDSVAPQVHNTQTRGIPNPDGYPSERPEDKPLRGKRAMWVAKEVIDKRREEGRCLRCGRDGCIVKRCPLKAAQNPNRSKSGKARVERAKVSQAAVEEEDSLTVTSIDSTNSSPKA